MIKKKPICKRWANVTWLLNGAKTLWFPSRVFLCSLRMVSACLHECPLTLYLWLKGLNPGLNITIASHSANVVHICDVTGCVGKWPLLKPWKVLIRAVWSFIVGINTIFFNIVYLATFFNHWMFQEIEWHVMHGSFYCCLCKCSRDLEATLPLCTYEPPCLHLIRPSSRVLHRKRDRDVHILSCFY